MIKRYLILLIISSILFSACNFSKGAKTDLRTGLSFSYNGFQVQDVLLIDPANQRMTDNTVQLNTRVAVVAIGINNYGLKDGKVFPGMMLSVTDKKGKSILKADDVFAGGQGYEPAQATELSGNITVAKPMVSGETYHVKMRIWDKIKPDNELKAETDLVVK